MLHTRSYRVGRSPDLREINNRLSLLRPFQVRGFHVTNRLGEFGELILLHDEREAPNLVETHPKFGSVIHTSAGPEDILMMFDVPIQAYELELNGAPIYPTTDGDTLVLKVTGDTGNTGEKVVTGKVQSTEGVWSDANCLAAYSLAATAPHGGDERPNHLDDGTLKCVDISVNARDTSMNAHNTLMRRKGIRSDEIIGYAKDRRNDLVDNVFMVHRSPAPPNLVRIYPGHGASLPVGGAYNISVAFDRKLSSANWGTVYVDDVDRTSTATLHENGYSLTLPIIEGVGTHHIRFDRLRSRNGDVRKFSIISSFTLQPYELGALLAHNHDERYYNYEEDIPGDTVTLDDTQWTGWGAITPGIEYVQDFADAVDLTLGHIRDFFVGVIIETLDALVTSNGSIVTMSLEQQGGGDLTMVFSDGNAILDCDPTPKTITLTAGDDDNPTTNYIYILQSTKVLTKSTTQWPTAEHIKVGYFLVPSVTEVQNNGCYINQNWNDHSKNGNNQGHYSHITETIRLTMGGASWHSGVNPNAAGSVYLDITGSSPSTVYFKSSSGISYQMHKHTIPAVDTSGSDICHVINWNGDAYHAITDLATIIDDANGNSLSNKYFNLVFWGVANKTGEHAPLMCNLPTGSYTGASNAVNDINGYDVTDIPHAFIQDSTTGFLICRITCKQTPTGTWTIIATTDLRGVKSGTSASGGVVGGTLTEFADNVFTIYSVGDNTKIVDFILTGISTGNTRTVTPSDADMTIPDTVNWTDLTDSGETALHIHDGRYYTKDEIDASWYTAAEVDSAITSAISTHSSSSDHDGRYYTETEVNNLLGDFAEIKVNTGDFSPGVGATDELDDITTGNPEIGIKNVGGAEAIQINIGGTIFVWTAESSL